MVVRMHTHKGTHKQHDGVKDCFNINMLPLLQYLGLSRTWRCVGRCHCKHHPMHQAPCIPRTSWRAPCYDQLPQPNPDLPTADKLGSGIAIQWPRRNLSGSACLGQAGIKHPHPLAPRSGIARLGQAGIMQTIPEPGSVPDRAI